MANRRGSCTAVVLQALGGDGFVGTGSDVDGDTVNGLDGVGLFTKFLWRFG